MGIKPHCSEPWWSEERHMDIIRKTVLPSHSLEDGPSMRYFTIKKKKSSSPFSWQDTKLKFKLLWGPKANQMGPNTAIATSLEEDESSVCGIKLQKTRSFREKAVSLSMRVSFPKENLMGTTTLVARCSKANLFLEWLFYALVLNTVVHLGHHLSWFYAILKPSALHFIFWRSERIPFFSLWQFSPLQSPIFFAIA